MPFPTKIKKRDWLDRLPKPIQAMINYAIAIALVAFVVVLIVIVYHPQAAPLKNYIVDLDCTTMVVAIKGTTSWSVNYIDTNRKSRSVTMAIERVDTTQPWRGSACPNGGNVQAQYKNQ